MQKSVDFAERAWELGIGLGESFVRWFLTSGVQILIVLALAWVASRVARRLLRRVHRAIAGDGQTPDRVKRADTLTGLLGTVATIVIFIAAGMMVLQEVGVAIGPLLATAGLGGLAIGFGAQSLVRDVITGFFVLAEENIRIGDVVEVGGKSGVVERIGLRTIRLRDLSGNVHVVPHGSVDVVTNMTTDYGCYVFDVGVAYREDPDEVIEALKQLGKEMQEDPSFASDILEPLEIFGVNSLDDSAVVIRARFKTKPIKQWAIGREFNRRIKKRFDELGIEIPFPHVTIYAGQDKDGAAPPVPVTLHGEGKGNGEDPAASRGH